MSNEYKRPAVVLTEEMKRAARNAPLPMVLLDSISARQDLEFESKFYAAIAAAPQPPALDDEVEIGIGSDEVIEELKMMADMADNNEDPDDHLMYMRWLAAIRSANAQVAPLKAELEQLKSEIAAYKASRERLHEWIREEQLKNIHLKARCDELEDLLRDINDASGGSQFKKHIDAALSRPAEGQQAKPRETPSRIIKLSGCEFTEDDLLRRAVRAVGGSRRNTMPRWALVRDAFGCGSGVGTALCRRFGYDPEEILKS